MHVLQASTSVVERTVKVMNAREIAPAATTAGAELEGTVTNAQCCASWRSS